MVGLQDPGAQAAHLRDPGDLIYVHAQGKFCAPLTRQIADRFLCHLGPEVKLLHMWLFFGAFLTSAVVAAVGLTELIWLSRTVMAPRPL